MPCVSGVGTATFNATATAGSVSAANSSVSASPSTVSVGGTSTITVTVRDGSNNPVGGASVSLASSGEGNTIAPATATTESNGVATFTFSSTVAETKTITASAGGVTITDQATITVQKTSSTVEIESDEEDPSTVNEPILVQVTVRGSGGTPTGEVAITLSGGSESCTAPLSNGAGSCSLIPTAAGPDGNNNRRIITATYAGDARFSGDTDTENHRVNPVPPANNPPTAAFTPPTCTVGQPCPFDDTSTDSDGSIASRSWTFQDGVPATSNDDNPQITFASEGSKSVTLTVTDDDGASNSVTHSVTVNPATPTNQPPTAAFETFCDETRACFFTNNSTDFDGDVVAWSWDFGDPLSGTNNTSTLEDPSHTFSEPGTYIVTLTVTDDEGAPDTETATLTLP